MAKPIDPLEETKSASVEPGRLSAGVAIGGYRLLEVLGEGGMGVVWSAHDPDLDRTLAIKVLKRSDAVPSLRLRLLREGRAMARLKHPNVLTVYEVGTDSDRDFIAMELVEGGSLDQWLSRRPSRTEVLDTLLAAGRGLAAAHAAGLVHRDFKPHNVLRSNDGRVLVTDFGLARGLGEDSATGAPTIPARVAPLDQTLDAHTPSAPGRTDSVLNSTLTQTGALIGTPAYMAPEQFAGSAPDPRTDQFAFCVTAWQALTGARPYTGRSIEELRIAATVGVGDVDVDLPTAMRVVLVRGLDPDPDRRWPSLEILLDAFAKASRPPRPRWPFALGAVGLVGAAVGLVLVARRAPVQVAAASPCAPAETTFSEAWSPAMRGELGRANHAPSFDRVADAFDDFRSRWLATYAQTCKDPTAKLFNARLGCLLAVRDQVTPLTHAIRMANEPMLHAFDVRSMLPNMTVCTGDSPVSPPAVPDDPATRAQVFATLANALALEGRPTAELPAAIAKLEAAALPLGWAPLTPRLLTVAANLYLRRGDHLRARELFLRAQPLASAAHDTQVDAAAWLGLLDVSIHELETPDAPATTKRPIHPELSRLLAQARAAVHAAGDDPLLAGGLAAVEAEVQLGWSQWKLKKSAYNDAIEDALLARTHFEQAGDLARAAKAAALVAQIYLARGDERALDDALYVARSADEALARAHLAHEPALDMVRGTVAFAHGDFTEAHARFDKLADGAPSPEPVHAGRVLDVDGKPAYAQVVAWRGDLDGDPERIFIDRRAVAGGEVIETATDGTFTIHAADDAVIMAEGSGQRSLPQRITAGPITIRMAPTTSHTGTVEGRNLVGVDAFARYSIGSGSWTLRAPVEKDATFHLSGLPRGAPEFGTIGAAGMGTRRVNSGVGATRLQWPVGRGIEIIVRTEPQPERAAAWVFRGKVAPRTYAEAVALETQLADVARTSLGPIGADATDAGRDRYHAGDVHGVITGNADGVVSVCDAIDDQPGTAVRCHRLTMVRGVIIDYADGRYGADVMPIVDDLTRPAPPRE